ncbi:hypothetical protein Barb7_03140 [Bacteroidales bacterium Barb7]|nr:hypothetical protein Barb7_03140 [Bacteroidales bacterium Barb7]
MSVRFMSRLTRVRKNFVLSPSHTCSKRFFNGFAARESVWSLKRSALISLRLLFSRSKRKRWATGEPASPGSWYL